MERGAKKLINQPEDVVEQSVQGLLAASPRHLRRLEGLHVIVRSDWEVTFLLLFLNSTPELAHRPSSQAVKAQGLVALLSGGGSGHEPSHAGFIGEALLTGAVLGGVFASPSVASILAAIRAVTGPAGKRARPFRYCKALCDAPYATPSPSPSLPLSLPPPVTLQGPSL
jgi:dihydroxyacetone kinase